MESTMRKIKRIFKSFIVAMINARRDAVLQKAKSGLYHWE
jgi:hypothetical protein